MLAAGDRARSRRLPGPRQAQTKTLVVDRSFEIRTSDPQRAFEPTASIVDRAVYDTLLTFRGGDVSRPRLHGGARLHARRRDAKTYTFDLRRDIRFADGTPMTAADVVFSFRRLINLKGNPSFLLAGVTVSAARPVHRRPALGDAEHGDPGDRREHVARDRELEAREAERRDGRGRTRARPTGRSGGSTRRRRSAPGSGPYVLQAVQHDVADRPRPEPALLGAEARVRAGRDPQHGRRDAVHQRPARHARGRDRPLRPAGPVAPEQPPREGDGRSRPPGCSGCSRTTTRTSRPRPRTSASRTPCATRSTTRRSCGSPAAGRSRREGSSRRCSSARCRRSAAVRRNLAAGEERARRVGRRRPDVHARVPERPHDQRRRLRHARAARAGEPPGDRA